MLWAALCCIQRVKRPGLQPGAVNCRPSAGSLIAVQLHNTPGRWALLNLLLWLALLWWLVLCAGKRKQLVACSQDLPARGFLSAASRIPGCVQLR